mmetsp:Transcript_20982/g.45944  ORF Transcript_20982/g.45944 Transcript_20982/m.45944 type:complete len:252 (+) Transcript_20982:215-970(+)
MLLSRLACKLRCPKVENGFCVKWNRHGHVARLHAPPASANRVHTMACFQGTTVKELEEWLKTYGVNTEQYGTGLSKTVADLLDENQKAESVLHTEDGKALRVVQVLSLHILNRIGQILFEEEQILPDGRSRRRNVPVSEKLIGSEPWRNAVSRAIHEELGTALPLDYNVTVFDDTYRLLTEHSSSLSYPGLTTKYIFHRVNAQVTGLPEGPFSTFEERPGGQLVTRWVWRSLQDIQAEVANGTSTADKSCS